MTTRRKWIETALIAGGAAATSCRRPSKLIGIVPFENEGQAPVDTLLGDELDGRQFTDLTHLGRDHLVTPTGQFYIRTRASHLLDTSRPWSVSVGAREIPLDLLKSHAEPMGMHLMECAGNNRAARFGMISVAQWHGVPLSGVLDGDPRQNVPISTHWPAPSPILLRPIKPNSRERIPMRCATCIVVIPTIPMQRRFSPPA